MIGFEGVPVLAGATSTWLMAIVTPCHLPGEVTVTQPQMEKFRVVAASASEMGSARSGCVAAHAVVVPWDFPAGPFRPRTSRACRHRVIPMPTADQDDRCVTGRSIVAARRADLQKLVTHPNRPGVKRTGSSVRWISTTGRCGA